jgi:hypothetical protein
MNIKVKLYNTYGTYFHFSGISDSDKDKLHFVCNV